MSNDTPRSASSSEDAIDLMLDDQQDILELFDRYDGLAGEQAPADRRRDLAEEICTMLTVHAAIKQEIFYPAASQELDDDELIEDALVAVDGVLTLVADIQSGDPSEPRYDTMVRALHETVMEHFEEEQKRLFSRLRRSGLDLDELGAELSARQEVLLTVDEGEELG